jgi:glutathione S-transferase
MTTLLYSPPSPYSAKVRMAAAWCGVALDSKAVSTSDEPAILLDANPLGKIPVLLLDGGDSVYDSRAITQYLNRVAGGTLFPRNAAKRTEAERLEALADGICDCLLAHVYERRHRPDEKVHAPWLDAQWEKVKRGLDLLESQPPKLSKKTNGGQIALRAMLGYLSLRFEGKWERGHGKLVRWAGRFDDRFPELAVLVPSA